MENRAGRLRRRAWVSMSRNVGPRLWRYQGHSLSRSLWWPAFMYRAVPSVIMARAKTC